ncbi:MAG TPA: type II secretion system protein [Hyphomicrobiales bacterium]|nr:type II secretion system protein [Hyphomicrobiales bacterium]
MKPADTTRNNQRGLTLVEMIVAIVIMAVALVLVARTVASGVAASPQVVLEARAIALAQSYLDEILARRFDEGSAPNGIPPYTGSCTVLPEEIARADYDDVDDYDGLQEGFGHPGPLLDARGLPRSDDYAQYAVEVSVRCLDAGSSEGEAAFNLPSNDLKLITVTVRHPGHTEGWAFSAYKANF